MTKSSVSMFAKFSSLSLKFFVLLVAAFLFTRFFQITTSFMYFNDMGRDSSVLLDWQESGKPPLLGPQTSALPFNQSAAYFYALFPFFVLTHGSAFSALYTNALIYVVTFGVLFYLAKGKPFLQKAVLITFWFVIIHPQFIIQNRFVWNPSFLAPTLLLSFAFFVMLKEKFSWQNLTVFSLSLASAAAFNFSALPVMIAFGLATLVLFREVKQVVLIGCAMVVAIFVTNLPTVVFEIRHNFVLTQMMLYREKLPQSGAGFSQKLHDLLFHVFAFETFWPNMVVFLTFVGVIAAGVYWYSQEKTKENLQQKQLFFLSVGLLLASVVVTLVAPVTVHSHYIFGILTLGIIALAFLPGHILVLGVAILSLAWLTPLAQGKYFQPARRTVDQMEKCFAQVCREQNQPMFVSTQAGFHVYHNGPEHRFLMRKAGCSVKDIETAPEAAQKMAVVVDDSRYEHGKTLYNELALFGSSQELQTYSCQENFQVVILEKSKK